MATPEEQAAKLLDFDQDLDITLLDSVVECMYSGSGEMQRLARDVLTTLMEHPQAWTRVDTILELSMDLQTKYYALQILESVIKTRWKTLPREQCEGIRKYIFGVIVKISTKSDRAERENMYLSKLNMVLVLILEREWPKHWPSFISDIVGASKTNESLCKNNMAILKLLSEEVFDFSNGKMTHIKAKHLKDVLCSEFPPIFELWLFVLDNSVNAALVGATLETLLRFLSWVPLGYIFETPLIRTLIYKFLNVPLFQNVTLKCLTEIAGLATGPQYDNAFVALFSQTMLQLEQMLPLDDNIKEAFAKGHDAKQNFIQNLAMFLCTILRKHRPLMERREKENTFKAHRYLLLISEVEEIEIFKICLDYWNILTKEVHKTKSKNITALFVSNQASVVRNPHETSYWTFHKIGWSRLRSMIISRMAKPEEVTIMIENGSGEVVRELTKYTDSINLHKLIQETLIYLTHLDQGEVERIMTDKLQKEVNGSEWSFKNLNTLCWAIGSVSGAMHEQDETRFLITVIEGLLKLYEKKEGKDDKAIIASNLMYVAGQYPRFLRAHWKFLKTIVNKLFEFMHETHDGVQNMACDTLTKIAQKCRRQFVQVQAGEVTPFIEEILTTINTIICDLQPQQVHTFYEAVGYMISAESDPIVQEAFIQRCMLLPNQVWDDIINQATRKDSVLKDANVVKQLADVLKTNVRACEALGHPYVSQWGRIYLDMLNVYKVMSVNISEAVVLSREEQLLVMSMRLVKKETLKLISIWISRSNDPDLVLDNFIPPLLNAVLSDYQHCAIPSARDPGVLSTMATIVNKLEGLATPYIAQIFDAVFGCTLDMINKNFEEFPEYRVNFYVMLEAVNNHCFPAFVSLPPAQFKLVLDSIIWAFKHTMRNVADTGLDILYQLLQNVSQNEAIAQAFYQAYYIDILQHVFSVVTDTSHTTALTMHATILAYMFTIVEMGKVNVSLNSAAPVITPPEALAAANVVYVQTFVAELLHNAFPHLTQLQLKVTMEGLFNFDQDLTGFREHLRDFLVQIKEFTGDDNSDLYLEERELELRRAQEEKRKVQMSVPGILNPHEIAEEMQDLQERKNVYMCNNQRYV